ncbi:MAG: PQQ-binding-like beta-propeller repeat protein [Myxococcales bacterium]|nr:PQQ-binding-like beta-propeller repeat protein [Myxococcales bacterium]
MGDVLTVTGQSDSWFLLAATLFLLSPPANITSITNIWRSVILMPFLLFKSSCSALSDRWHTGFRCADRFTPTRLGAQSTTSVSGDDLLQVCEKGWVCLGAVNGESNWTRKFPQLRTVVLVFLVGLTTTKCGADTQGNGDGSTDLVSLDDTAQGRLADLTVSSIEIPPETDPGTELWFIPVEAPGTIPPTMLLDGRIGLVDAAGTIRLISSGGDVLYEKELAAYVGQSGSVSLTAPVGGAGNAIVGASFHDQDVTCDHGGALLSVPIPDGQLLPVLDGTPEIFGPPAVLNGQTIWATVGYQWNQFGDLCAKGIVLSAALAISGKSVLIPAPARGVSVVGDGSIRTVSDPDVVAAYSSDLKQMWTKSLDGLGIGEPALLADGSIVVTLGSRLITLDSDGNLVWDRTWSKGVSKLVGQPAVGSDGIIFAPATVQGGGTKPNAPAVVAATKEGNELWSVVIGQTKVVPALGVTCGTPVVSAQGSLYVACGNGTLAALNQGTGAVVWKVEDVATATSPVLTSNGILVTTGVDGYRGIYVGQDSLSSGAWARYRGNNQSTGSR